MLVYFPHFVCTELLGQHIMTEASHKPITSCTQCLRETAPHWRCICLQGGGGEGGDSSESSSLKEDKTDTIKKSGVSENSTTLSIETPAVSFHASYAGIISESKPSAKPITFDLLILAKYLANNTVSIRNDASNGKLSIFCNPTLILALSPHEKEKLKEDMLNLIALIEEQFDSFSEKYPNLGNLKKLDIDSQGMPTFFIQITTPTHYDKCIYQFISRIEFLKNPNNLHARDLLITLLQNKYTISDQAKQKAKSKYLDAIQESPAESLEEKNPNRHIYSPLEIKPRPKWVRSYE